MSLLSKLKAGGSIKSADVLSESSFFNMKDVIPTEIPIINIAFSADPDGGLVSGTTMIAGESKSFKTLLMLLCMKAYLEKYTEAVALLYDAEYGITVDYIKNIGIDTSRVIHIPVQHIEELKFDIVKRLDLIERGDKVFVGIDSIGALASKKEVEDAEDGKSVADMTRAKALKSLFRIIGPHFTTKDIPLVAINHTYKELALYPKNIVGGGTGAYYTAQTIFIISKSQEKEGTELAGWKFTINIEKSRFVREKSKFPFTVLYGGGIQKYSGLFDLGLEMGYIKKVTPQTYAIPSLFAEKAAKRKAYEDSNTVWVAVLKDPVFKEMIYSNFSYATNDIFNSEDDDAEIEALLETEEQKVLGEEI